MTAASGFGKGAGQVREFLASDGRTLTFRRWSSVGEPRAQIVALHGIQSHSGWYGYSSSRLADAGIEVLFLDRRGSGLSRCGPEELVTVERLCADVAEFVMQIDAEMPEGPGSQSRYLLGLSWGARLAPVVCDRYAHFFDGLILLYPGICTQIRPNKAQMAGIRLLQLLGGARRTVALPLNPAQFTGDAQWRSFIESDPLAVRRVSIAFLAASERLERLALDALKRLDVPRLALLAGQDEIVDVPRTRLLLTQIPQNSLRVIEYPDARHTLEFEPDRDRFVDDMIQWIESQV
ncbi:MAG: alpha/beta fold hydrolase [Planctomycetaceae bacterium]|nr:alpha/beta fold hydrolase [Planctomycetaceae bacterium]